MKNKNPFANIPCHPCEQNSDSMQSCTCTKFEDWELNNSLLFEKSLHISNIVRTIVHAIRHNTKKRQNENFKHQRRESES